MLNWKSFFFPRNKYTIKILKTIKALNNDASISAIYHRINTDESEESIGKIITTVNRLHDRNLITSRYRDEYNTAGMRVRFFSLTPSGEALLS